MTASEVAPAVRVDIAAAAQLACLLEVSAPKPGNVSPGRQFADARVEDFLASAAAIGAPLAGAGERPLGATIRLAVDATRRWTRTNTNLGIVLLLAPLATARHRDQGGQTPVRDDSRRRGGQTPVRDDSRWRDELRRVLERTTVQDARDVYAAIRLAAPGGLGHAGSQDVRGEPTVTLLEAMRLAAHRDGIAREYATAFETTFELGAPTLAGARRRGAHWDDAVTDTFLTLLAARPDTHIERRAGPARAAEVSRRARDIVASGGLRTAYGRAAIAAFDASLRDARHTANPGTTADLTAAAIFVALLEGAWETGQGGTHAGPR
jgi:triphosphoribosyl-dephospho-CoA synthase